MKNHLAFISMFATILTIGWSSYDTTPKEYILSATATYKDGSSIQGILLSDTIKGNSLCKGSLEIPATAIKSITFTGTNGESKVSFVNDDTLSMTITNPTLELDTSLEKISLYCKELDNLALSARSIAKPKRLKDGNYCIIDISGGIKATSFPVWYTNELPEGNEFKTTSIVLKKIPAGTFMMSNKAKVTISKPFYIGVYEITRRQFQLLSTNDSWQKRFWAKGDNPDFPANAITYNMIRGTSHGAQWPTSKEVDAGTILDILRKKTGLTFDLPTEAQWEYACRAGTTSLYNNGGNSESDLKKLGRYRGSGRWLAKVGSYEPNDWGLYDMHGNVFEWCLDWGPWPIKECVDPVGNPNGSKRCLRGGSHDYRADECTSSFRYYNLGHPSNESSFYGLRLVCPAK